MLSFWPRLIKQIVGVSPFYWQTIKAKISISPLLAELIRHSSYDSFALPKILPCAPQIFPYPLALTFLFSHFFIFSLINKSIKKNFIKYRFY
jgi:hypothetical protein